MIRNIKRQQMTCNEFCFAAQPIMNVSSSGGNHAELEAAQWWFNTVDIYCLITIYWGYSI